ncbi:MAG: chloride channel protein [Polyangiaceae bacterium]|nr:chloride channel protein [Polyangiaceae bacterium]
MASAEPSIARRVANSRRTALITSLAVGLAGAASLAAHFLTRLIAFVTNLAFYGRWSVAAVSPAANRLGPWVVFVPAAGGLVVGLMARFGSKAIRGHGIPEAMEQILVNKSRIPKRITVLKPVSAAIAIGTGGPFGAEGPIIATGGAMGSLVGQVLRTTPLERKTLLAAGAAAGMAATFGSPVSAVLLAVELLLFEYRARSLVPVAMSAATATAVRAALEGPAPAFAMPDLVQPVSNALPFYIALGALMGLVSVGVTRAVYAVEDAFERLPIHWMWWPALGGLGVGLVGWMMPRTLGVGYDNIDAILSGHLLPTAMLLLCTLKFISWVTALGSGTSGGTLAPLLTIGGALGATVGSLAADAMPGMGIDARVAGLVGMAAMFAGASRALLASVVFAFEATRQPLGLPPLLGSCAAAFLVSSLLMKNTIMTEKIGRRGVRVAGEYGVDPLEQVRVGECATREVRMLAGTLSIADAKAWLDSGSEGSRHQGFPVVDETGQLAGVVTRADLFAASPLVATVNDLIHRSPVVAFEDAALLDAASAMAKEQVGRLPVVSRAAPRTVVGIVSRSDVIAVHGRRHGEDHVEPPTAYRSFRAFVLTRARAWKR